MPTFDNTGTLDPQESALEKIRSSAEDWASGVESALRQSLVSVGAVDSGGGQSSIDSLVALQYGDSLGIWFGFRRYLVMVEKGAGRGHGGKKGSSWRGKDGKIHRTNPASLGKINTGHRKAMRWFNPVIKREIGKLADLAAENFAIQATKILIK